MPQPYNLTNLTDANNLFEFFRAGNQLSEGYLGLMLLIGTWLVFFFSFKGYDTKRAFAGTSFITAVAAILLRLMQFISNEVMFMSFILVGISVVMLRMGD